MSSSFDLPDVDRFLCGTEGPAGQRVFYLQAVTSNAVVTLRCEKQQVALLADYLERVLATHDLPTGPPATFGELAQPLIPEWIVGGLAVAVNEASGQVVIVAEELVADVEPESEDVPLDDPEPDGAQARFSLSVAQVSEFIRGARAAVAGGRPTCRLCGRPIDPEGHACPRMN